MNTNLYNAIDAARQGVGIKNAQAEIAKELNRLQFAGLLHILSNFFNVAVYLAETSNEAIQTFLKRVIREMNKRRLATGKPQLSEEAIQYITEKHKTLEIYQGVRYRDNNGIHIVVASLDPIWLEQTSANHKGVTNSDLVHMAVAHEVIGMLYAIDTYKADIDSLNNLANNTLSAEEEKTHALAAEHLLSHLLTNKMNHRGASYYDNKRSDLILALGAALNGQSEPSRQRDFSSSVGEMITAFVTSRNLSKIRECPRVCKLMCPNGRSLQDCAIADQCNACNL